MARSFDSERVIAHVQRAEIELCYAVSELTGHEAVADYPEIADALAALVSALAKLEQANGGDSGREGPTTG